MGWASGSDLMVRIIRRVKRSRENDPFTGVSEIYDILIREFENSDCDTLDECLGMDTYFDYAYRRLHSDRE